MTILFTHIRSSNDVTADIPLENNPLREDRTKQDIARDELNMRRLMRDAQLWLDPNYRTITNMRYKKGE